MNREKNFPETLLEKHLKYLKLSFMREHHQELARQAVKKKWSHVHFLEELAEQEAALRHDRATKRRIRLARFPVI